MQLRPIASALFIALLGGPLLSSCSKFIKATPEEYIQKAKDAQTNGELSTAVIYLKNALEQQPGNAQARLLLGKIFIKTQNGGPAETELLKAKALGVRDEAIKGLLGEAYLLQQQYQKVLDDIQVVPGTSSLNQARILRERGDAQIGLGHMETGCGLFQKATEVSAEYAPAYRQLAKCSMAHHNYAEAKARLDTALKIDPQDPDNWSELGDLELLRNNQEAAKNAFLKAKDLDHANVRAAIGLVTVYLINGEMDKATEEIQAARKEHPGNVLVRYNQALIHFRQGKYPLARDELQEVLRNMPNHMPSVLLSGAVAYALGSYEQANQNLSRFLSYYPGNYYAAKVLAATDLKLNKPQDALRIIGLLLAAFPDNPQILTLAGTAYGQTKDYIKATEYFEKAASIQPKNADIRTRLAYAQMGSGDTQQAINTLESAAALGTAGDVTAADAMLVVTHLRQKDYDKALAAAQAWQKNQPDNPLVYNLEGTAYLGKKDVANARKSFEQALKVMPTYLPAAENLGKLDLLDKNPVAAKARFEKILNKDEKNVGAMLDLADLAMVSGKSQEYVGWIEKAIKAKPSLLSAYRRLTDYYLKNKDIKKALSVANQAQASNIGNPDALDLLGATQLAAGLKADALATYKNLVSVASNSPVSYVRLASVQAIMKDTAGAKASLKKALDLKPDFLDAQTALAMVYLQSHEYDDALAVTRQIQQANPRAPLGAGLEGDVLMSQKQYVTAAKAFGKALEIGNNGLFAIKQHQALSLAGQGAQADAALLGWLKKSPNDLQSRAYLGESYARDGHYSQAIEQYEYVIGRMPNNFAVLNNLALAYDKQNNPRALATAEKAYQLAPGNPTVLDTYGWILLKQGNATQATQLLQKAVAKAPIPTIRYHLAVALAKSGDRARARQELEQLLHAATPFTEEQDARTLLKTLR